MNAAAHCLNSFTERLFRSSRRTSSWQKSQERSDAAKAQAFAAALSKLPNMFLISLDSSLAEQAAILATQHGLRGADSVYAAVAKKYDCILISLDKEHLTRLAGVVAVQRPEDALKGIVLPRLTT